MNFREVFREAFSELKYKKGKVFIVKVKNLYERTRIALSGYNGLKDKSKKRPIILINTTEDKIYFFALSRYIILERPKINTENCDTKSEIECLGMNINNPKEKLIFAKETPKLKACFYINKHIFEELENEGNIIYCGSCDDKVLNEAIKKIKDFTGESC